MILDAIRKKYNCGVSVEETRIREWIVLDASREGLPAGPEAAACAGAAELLAKSGWIELHERVIIYAAAHRRDIQIDCALCSRALIYMKHLIGIGSQPAGNGFAYLQTSVAKIDATLAACTWAGAMPQDKKDTLCFYEQYVSYFA